MPSEREAHLLLEAVRAGISSPRELANLMAQVGHESAGLTRLDEGFRYTKGITQITGKVRSALREGPEALEAARLEALRGKPEKLAELMYGGRMGNTSPGDGWKFHGRGYIQLTGKENYQRAGQELGLDLLTYPELAAEPEGAARVAIHFWESRVPKDAREDVTAATRAVNGGENGLADRMARFARWEKLLTPDVVQGLACGEVLLPVLPARRGIGDPAVESTQRNLNTLGIPDAQGLSLVADGNYGPRTRQAIESFQRQHGMPVDGMVTTQLLSATQIAVSVTEAVRGARQLGQHYGAHSDAVPGWPGIPHAGLAQPGTPRPMEHAPTRAPFDGVRSHVATTESRVSPHVVGTAVTPTFASPDLARTTVENLQENLNRLGFTDARGRPLADDGRYGPSTRAAVAAFQHEQGFSATGIADNTTLTAIQAHVVVADLQRDKGEREAQEQFQRQTSAYDPRIGESPSHHDPLARESATMHSARYSHATGLDGLRGVYTPPSAQQSNRPVEAAATPVPHRATDVVDHHSGLEHARWAPPGAQTLQEPTREPLSYRNAAHPHHPLFQQLRQTLPADVSDEKVAELTLAAREGGVRPNRVESVHVHDGKAWVLGTIPGFDGMVDLRTPAPPMAETMHKAEVFEEQQQMKTALWQQREPSQSHGRSM